MTGQRILERLANGPLAYRALEKRVSAKYRKESFKADFDQLKADGVIYTYKEGRTRFVALSCPGEQPEPPKSPAVAVRQFGRFHVGDTVRVIKAVASYANGWYDSWQDTMDKMIGETSEILRVSNQFQEYRLKDGYGYPEESLELVKHADNEGYLDVDFETRSAQPLPVALQSEVETAFESLVSSLLSSGCGGSTSVQSQDQLEPIVEEQPKPMDIETDFSFSEPAIENVFVPDYRPTDNVEPKENPKHGEEGHQHRFGDEDIISDDEVTMGEVDGKIAIVLPDRIVADISKIVHEAFEEVVAEEAAEDVYLKFAKSVLPVGALVFVNETYMDELFKGRVGTVIGYDGMLVNVRIDEPSFHGLNYIFLPEHLTPLKPEDSCDSAALAKAHATLYAPYAFEESGSYESNWFIPLSESVTNKLLRISKHLANLEDKTSCTTDHALNAAQKTLRQTFKLFV
jgi:hypothetical protein